MATWRRVMINDLLVHVHTFFAPFPPLFPSKWAAIRRGSATTVSSRELPHHVMAIMLGFPMVLPSFLFFFFPPLLQYRHRKGRSSRASENSGAWHRWARSAKPLPFFFLPSRVALRRDVTRPNASRRCVEHSAMIRLFFAFFSSPPFFFFSL